MSESTSPKVAIKILNFCNGENFQFSNTDVVVIVGPNNAGKSAVLRAIRDKLKNPDNNCPVLGSIKIQRTGSLDSIKKWLSEWTVVQNDSSPSNPLFQALGHAVHQSQAEYEWKRSDESLGTISRWFCHLLTADERLKICDPPKNIALSRDNPKHPIHFLLRDEKIENKLSGKFRKAFGADLVVHRNAGNEIPLHVGERPVPGPDEDRVSMSYISRLEKLPTLQTQGDGMRSFAGVLLATSVGQESIILIDEPEAFLHPPQARLLGTTLVQDRNKERQIFVATHSADVLRGILDAESKDVRVIRIRRNDKANIVRLLSNERIKELWSDPLLRYSNILDGLFHESVIVCEADSDCRFYAAILDAIMSTKADDAKRPDLMFTHCGGKARIPVVIRALKEIDVPVKAVADFDVLSEQEPLKSISEALGISWSDIQADWSLVKNSVDSKKPDMSTADVKKEVVGLLEGVNTPQFPPKIKSEIQKILKRSSPWAHAKLVGKSFVPSGDPSKACERLLSKLRAGGLYVVEVGELEGYVRTEGGHGPKWINSVLSRDLSTDPELEIARDFLRDLADL